MKTYQDLLALGENEKARMDFVLSVIEEHRSSSDYKIAEDAEKYASGKNATIMSYQKLLYTVSGRAIPDNYSANHKCASGFYRRFLTQEVAVLLGNGVTFKDEKVKASLGADFDKQLYFGVKSARKQKIAFGFWNRDHLEMFEYTEFVPLWDEEDGMLKAGIRFWRLDDQKPLRCTLYELDGYTDFIRRQGKDIEIMHEKRPYIVKTRENRIDGKEIYGGRNYPSFPIVPLWGAPERQSTLIGLREQIDCYDLIKSGFANDLDDASMIYWTITNAGGMDDVDLAEFVQRIKTVHAATVDGTGNGTSAQAHTIDVPHESRETYLSRLSKDLYRDAMALDVDQVAAGNITATQIETAYEPLNEKLDEMEFCILEFLDGIMALANVQDTPTFTRSKIVNRQEEIDMVISSADYLDDEYVTRKILTILGDGDAADAVMRRKAAEDSARYSVEEQMGGEDENAATGENSGSGEGEE